MLFELRGLSMFDYMFLASGVLFILIGLAFIRSGSKDTVSTHVPPGYNQV